MKFSRQRTWTLLLVWVIGLTALLVVQNKDLRRLPGRDQSHRSLPSSSSPPSTANQAIYNDRNGLAACLLVMDDNHFLVEWIAYHYFVGPLRSLIIAVDPRSTTSPASIVERYRESELNITIWYHNDYYKDFEVKQVRQLMQQVPSPNVQVQLHRKRQRIFFDRCLRQHQRDGWTYTLLSDTDEFLLVNYHHHTVPAWNNATTFAPRPIAQPGSVWHALHNRSTLHPNNDNVCVQIPRVRFGSVETTTSLDNRTIAALVLLNASHLATYRWRTHASDTDYRTNKLSKAMVDVSRLDTKFPPVTSMHRPIKSMCMAEKLLIPPSQQVEIRSKCVWAVRTLFSHY
jgi:hypothetical protein